jgi:hypothetical protein
MNINPLGTKNKIVTAGLLIFLKAKEESENEKKY